MCLAEINRHPLAPRLARHVGARARRDLDVLVRVPRAREDRSTCSSSSAAPHAHALLPGRRARRGHPRGVLPAGARVLQGRCRRRSTTTRRSSTRTRSGSSGRRASGCSRPRTRSRSGSRARCSARPASTGTSARTAVPRLRRGRLRRARVPERRRLRPLQGAHGRDARSRCASSGSASTGSRRCEGEPWIADDRKVVLPPREELHTSMESLIHHFKIVTEGYRVPEGEVYVAIESARGELGCYVVSDGGPKPWRVKFRAPSFVALQATATCLRDAAGRRHDRGRRLARRRHGRGRPVIALAPLTQIGTLVSMTLHDEIQSPRVPGPALGGDARAAARAGGARRLAPARGAPRGRRRARLTPAYCLSVASFYDMFHLEPVGRARDRGLHEHLLRAPGAQSVVEAFERELGVRAGETTEDGAFTLRAVECLGGCGWATVVAVDDRHRLRRARRRTCRDRRGAARDRLGGGDARRRRVVFAGTNGGALTEIAEYEAVGGFGARQGARRWRPTRSSRSSTPRISAAAAARSSRPGASGASSRSPTDAEAALPRRQRRRVRAGHVQGPRDHAAGSVPLPRGLPHRGARDRVEARLHLHPRRVRARVRGARRRARADAQGEAPRAASRSSSTAAPARTSAARRRRCSSRSRAGAASRGRSRRSPRSPASTRRRPPSTTSSRSPR